MNTEPTPTTTEPTPAPTAAATPTTAKKKKPAGKKKAPKKQPAAKPAAPATPPSTQDPAAIRPCLLIYDIPSDADLANPSGVLRRFAVRINLSCWVVPEGDTPYTLLNEMKQKGATWHVIKFDPAEAKKLIDLCIKALRQELQDQIDRSRASEEKAWDAVEAAETEGERTKLLARYLTRADILQQRFDELTEDLGVVITRFGIAPTALRLGQATAALNAIKASVERKAEKYVQSTKALDATGTTTGKALAAAAAKDAVPAGVLADALRDEGQDAEADSLVTTFQEPTEADADGTYSLGADDHAA